MKHLVISSIIPIMLSIVQITTASEVSISSIENTQSILKKVNELSNKTQQLENKVNAVSEQCSKILQEHKKQSNKLNDIEQKQYILQNKMNNSNNNSNSNTNVNTIRNELLQFPSSKDDTFLNKNDNFAKQHAQQIFDELRNAKTIDERKAIFEKYPDELNSISPVDKVKYISGDLLIDQDLKRQLFDNTEKQYNAPVYDNSSLFNSNIPNKTTMQQSPNIENNNIVQYTPVNEQLDNENILRKLQQANTPEARQEVLKKYPGISEVIDNDNITKYIENGVPFTSKEMDKILAQSSADNIIAKLKDPNISKEEKQQILRDYPAILQTLGNPSNIDQYLDGSIPFPPEFKTTLSKDILANNIVDKLNNSNTTPQQRHEILQQYPEIIKTINDGNGNIDSEKYKNYVNGSIPFSPQLKDSLSQQFMTNKTLDRMKESNNPQLIITNTSGNEILDTDNTRLKNVIDNKQVQNNKTPESYNKFVKNISDGLAYSSNNQYLTQQNNIEQSNNNKTIKLEMLSDNDFPRHSKDDSSFDFIKMSKEQLINELQKCKETCKILQSNKQIKTNSEINKNVQQFNISNPTQLTIHNSNEKSKELSYTPENYSSQKKIQQDIHDNNVSEVLQNNNQLLSQNKNIPVSTEKVDNDLEEMLKNNSISEINNINIEQQNNNEQDEVLKALGGNNESTSPSNDIIKPEQYLETGNNNQVQNVVADSNISEINQNNNPIKDSNILNTELNSNTENKLETELNTSNQNNNLNNNNTKIETTSDNTNIIPDNNLEQIIKSENINNGINNDNNNITNPKNEQKNQQQQSKDDNDVIDLSDLFKDPSTIESNQNINTGNLNNNQNEKIEIIPSKSENGDFVNTQLSLDSNNENNNVTEQNLKVQENNQQQNKDSDLSNILQVENGNNDINKDNTSNINEDINKQLTNDTSKNLESNINNTTTDNNTFIQNSIEQENTNTELQLTNQIQNNQEQNNSDISEQSNLLGNIDNSTNQDHNTNQNSNDVDSANKATEENKQSDNEINYNPITEQSNNDTIETNNTNEKLHQEETDKKIEALENFTDAFNNSDNN